MFCSNNQGDRCLYKVSGGIGKGGKNHYLPVSGILRPFLFLLDKRSQFVELVIALWRNLERFLKYFFTRNLDSSPERIDNDRMEVQMSRSKSICLPVVIVLVIAGFASMGLLSAIRIMEASAWNGEAVKLAALVSLPAEFAEIQGGFTSGSILTIDVSGDKPKADPVFLSLAKDLQPDKKAADKIGTAVLLRYGRVSTGEYSDGSSAYMRFVKVSVVDVATHAITAARSFDGGAPAATKSGGGEVSGSGVQPQEIARWIESLPRR
jgi:hypothetical protein